MNIQLVESLAQVIQALAPEEQQLLEEKLNRRRKGPPAAGDDRQATYKRIKALRSDIFARRGNQQLEPSAAELIQQMREERTEQLLSSSFPEQSTSDPWTDSYGS